MASQATPAPPTSAADIARSRPFARGFPNAFRLPAAAAAARQAAVPARSSHRESRPGDYQISDRPPFPTCRRRQRHVPVRLPAVADKLSSRSYWLFAPGGSAGDRDLHARRSSGSDITTGAARQSCAPLKPRRVAAAAATVRPQRRYITSRTHLHLRSPQHTAARRCKAHHSPPKVVSTTTRYQRDGSPFREPSAQRAAAPAHVIVRPLRALLTWRAVLY